MAVMLPSRAQRGIFDIFGELFSTIQNDMGAALNQINELTQEMQQLNQQIVWPSGAGKPGTGLRIEFDQQLSRFHDAGFHAEIAQCDTGQPTAIRDDPAQSAVVSDSPLFRRASRQTNGTVPAVNAASPQDRVMMDIDDALGQQSLKTTLIADQGQDVILATANQMENQVALSTPGSAPFITAQAQVANLRCQGIHAEDARCGTPSGGRPHRS